MAQNLMRPLRSDSLKPRPSTQAVWEPGKTAAPPAVPASQPRGWNPPIEEKPQEAAVPAPAPMPEPDPMPEEPLQPEAEPAQEEAAIPPEPPKEEPAPPAEEMPEPAEEDPLPGPQTFLFQTFAPEVISEPQPEPVYDEPVYAEPEEPFMEETPASDEEEPFDLDAVIAAILAEDEEDESEEDPPAAQDALPSEEMPAPAFVPLYEDAAPKRKKKGWLWLIAVALLAAAGFAAWHFGWLKGILP